MYPICIFHGFSQKVPMTKCYECGVSITESHLATCMHEKGPHSWVSIPGKNNPINEGKVVMREIIVACDTNNVPILNEIPGFILKWMKQYDAIDVHPNEWGSLIVGKDIILRFLVISEDTVKNQPKKIGQ